MKLRLVKFFTSRENEIEKKEGGEGRSPAIACSVTQLARNHSPRFRSPLLSSSFPFFLPPPSPTSPHPTAQLVGRHVSGEQCPPAIPSPSCPASPFFLHKITEAVKRGGKNRGGRPACRPSCNRRAPSSPHPRPPGSLLVLHHLRFLPSLGAVHPQRWEP